MAAEVNREVRLAARPVGLPRESDFAFGESPIPELRDGEVLVRNVYMSLDPATRGRMNGGEGRGYVPGFEIGQVLETRAVGVVERSRNAALAEGDLVRNTQGWREYYVSTDRELRKIEPSGAPLSAYLGALGMTGLTAYVGLLDIGRPRTGETVFVSAAAGGVGNLVGQIAKLKGCRAIGSAGSEEKLRFLVERCGYDAAFNYKTDDLEDSLSKLSPNGIDVYFDNAGGPQLQAALNHMNLHGRIPVCGNMSGVNATVPVPQPDNISNVLSKRLLMQGFIAFDHIGRMKAFLEEMVPWVTSGEVQLHETITAGLERAPRALIEMLEGRNLGKALVRLSDDPTAARGSG